MVPATLTWLLQPLDAKVFAISKRALSNRALDEAGATAEEHYIATATRQLVHAIQELLHRGNWSGLFRRLGYNGDAPATSTTLLKELGWEAMPIILRTRITLAEVRRLWPKNEC